MKKIIEEVLQTEEKVSIVLEQAHKKASEIRQSVEKEISEKMSDAKQKTREIIQATVEDAKKEAEHIREEKLKQADQEKETLLNNNADTIDNLVDDVCNIILTTEYEKDNK
jgi:vacuolar-type H+-ATPase subunit H